jgi:hypothetical protein
MRVVRLLGVSIALLFAVTACGGADEPSGTGNTPTERPQSASWPATPDPLNGTGLVWFADDAVHLGDGSTIEASDVAEFTVAGPGVWFVPERGTELHLATSEGARGLGVEPMEDTLASSADGRYLAFLHRPDDVAVTVVVDLTGGGEVMASSDGMGSAGDDLDALYEDVPVGIIGFDPDHVYVHTAQGIRSYSLTDGSLSDDSDPVLPDRDAATNPSGTWSFEQGGELPQPLVSADGRRAVPRLTGPLDFGRPRVRLVGWADDRTVVGWSTSLDLPDLGETLVSCRVPSGRCLPVSTSVGETLLPNDGVRSN